MEERLPAGEYTAVVVWSKVVNLESGSKVLILQLVIARGPHRGQRCEKKLFFGFDEEQTAKSRFLRMGATLRSLDTMGEDAKEVTGVLLAIRLYYDDFDRRKVLILRHHGRDDVRRYLQGV